MPLTNLPFDFPGGGEDIRRKGVNGGEERQGCTARRRSLGRGQREEEALVGGATG